jgi:hypothetical protein
MLFASIGLYPELSFSILQSPTDSYNKTKNVKNATPETAQQNNDTGRLGGCPCSYNTEENIVKCTSGHKKCNGTSIEKH